MKRILGSYGLKYCDQQQEDFQIQPIKFREVAGYKLPIGGPFTIAYARHGEVILYSSVSGETPIYFKTSRNKIHWGESYRDLDGDGEPTEVKPGTAVKWNIRGDFTTIKVERLPRPPIVRAIDDEEAINEYKNLLLLAVDRRLATIQCGKIGVSCSGGTDSLLVVWALQQLGREFVPFTACMGKNSLDDLNATKTLKRLGAPPTTKVKIDFDTVERCLPLGMKLYEDIGPNETYMQRAVCSVAIAQKCAEKGVVAIFNGHGQDDIQGGLRGIYKELKEMPDTTKNAEFWRDERQRSFVSQQLMWSMNKLFSAVYRHYDIEVRMPYFDVDFMEWAFSQPLSIIPVNKNKPFIRKVASRLLPVGPWNNPGYKSTGYVTGVGWKDPKCADLKEFLKVRSLVFYQELFGKEAPNA